MRPNYPEVDLHALFVDEAIDRLDRAISDAMKGGYDRIRIIHGKGTGRLRIEVWDYLTRDRRVRTFQHASPHDGGEGATVASLEVRR